VVGGEVEGGGGGPDSVREAVEEEVEAAFGVFELTALVVGGTEVPPGGFGVLVVGEGFDVGSEELCGLLELDDSGFGDGAGVCGVEEVFGAFEACDGGVCDEAWVDRLGPWGLSGGEGGGEDE
jgi:hypothetical protein